jgi:hypothetical protein
MRRLPGSQPLLTDEWLVRAQGRPASRSTGLHRTTAAATRKPIGRARTAATLRPLSHLVRGASERLVAVDPRTTALVENGPYRAGRPLLVRSRRAAARRSGARIRVRARGWRPAFRALQVPRWEPPDTRANTKPRLLHGAVSGGLRPRHPAVGRLCLLVAGSEGRAWGARPVPKRGAASWRTSRIPRRLARLLRTVPWWGARSSFGRQSTPTRRLR